MSEPRSAPTIGQLVLSRQLRILREKAGLSREQAGRLLSVTAATVRRMETADVALKIPYVQILLPAYGVPDAEAEIFLRFRTHSEVERFFDGLDLVEPGLVTGPEWYKDTPAPESEENAVYVGVARVG